MEENYVIILAKISGNDNLLIIAFFVPPVKKLKMSLGAFWHSTVGI